LFGLREIEERDREERKRREVGDFFCSVRREIEKREE